MRGWLPSTLSRRYLGDLHSGLFGRAKQEGRVRLQPQWHGLDAGDGAHVQRQRRSSGFRWALGHHGPCGEALMRMQRRFATACVIWCVGFAGVSCGGSSSSSSRSLPDPGPSSGLDTTLRLTALTPDEWDALCRWIAGRIGGWGQKVTCSDGDYLTSSPSESACTSITLTRPAWPRWR